MGYVWTAVFGNLDHNVFSPRILCAIWASVGCTTDQFPAMQLCFFVGAISHPVEWQEIPMRGSDGRRSWWDVDCGCAAGWRCGLAALGILAAAALLFGGMPAAPAAQSPPPRTRGGRTSAVSSSGCTSSSLA